MSHTSSSYIKVSLLLSVVSHEKKGTIFLFFEERRIREKFFLRPKELQKGWPSIRESETKRGLWIFYDLFSRRSSAIFFIFIFFFKNFKKAGLTKSTLSCAPGVAKLHGKFMTAHKHICVCDVAFFYIK